jgi:hypothetical protein
LVITRPPRLRHGLADLFLRAGRASRGLADFLRAGRASRGLAGFLRAGRASRGLAGFEKTLS